MEELIKRIGRLRRSPVSRTITRRMRDFKRKRTDEELFSELCFCLLTANFSSERSWAIQKSIGNGFMVLPRNRLASRLKGLGYRFPNARSGYITAARPLMPELSTILSSSLKPQELRAWFVDNVRGFGYKEASHFLRNVGKFDYAIVDFHILDILSGNRIFEKPKTLTPKRYLEAEESLAGICRATGLSQGELDLYLWYLETGKVLK